MTRNNNQSDVETIRHSLAHIMALAVKNLYKDVKFGIGPVIENGFYYDFEMEKDLSSDDLPKIESKMRQIIKMGLSFSREKMEIDEAIKFFKKQSQNYKVELLKDLKKEGEKEVSIYRTGEFVDLCRGPHVKSTREINPDAFKLSKIAGAYWKGSEKNPMLQRVYGIAFATKQELDDYSKMMEEAEKRDHRKIGKDLDLFSFHKEGPGFVFWHPKGTIIYQALENFIRKENEKRGYQEIKTPVLLKKDLWVASGHWEKFRDDMYFTEIDKEEFAVKPMSCPGAILIYNETMHSYRDLPLRFSEFGLVHRHELSGVLHGLLRLRFFTQDDAHSFCAEEQLMDEVKNMISYAVSFYKTFGFDKCDVYVATRPEKYIGDDKIWNKSTKALEKSLKEKNIAYGVKKGEGAFYGPKIEFNIKDAIGRNWQMGTIQIDFSMPKRLGAFYIDKKGKKKNPVMVHRAIAGSLERFIAILIEHYAGELPFWLSPVQVLILPIGKDYIKYALEVKSKLQESGLRIELNSENETLGKKIRTGELRKIPYILVIGEKEMKEKKINVRKRDDNSRKSMSLENFIEQIKTEIPKS